MIEDLHTAYSRGYGGGYRSKSNLFRTIADITNDMHHWYHTNGIKYPNVSSTCAGIHVYDSIAVFEKSNVWPPTHSQIGSF
jgi:hypothetical protein